MPFTHYNLPLVKKALDLTGGKKLATFSCPDLMMQWATLTRILGPHFEKVQSRPDSDEIVRWHKAHTLMAGEPVLDTWSVFEQIGVELTAFDVHPGRGKEVVFDLCKDVQLQEFSFAKDFEFDVLFDCIANQCFDVAQVFKNALCLVRAGGYIVHCLPATLLNQGFYDISPTLFKDFYESNGCTVVEHHLVTGVYTETNRLSTFDHFRRMRNVADDTMNLVLVRKDEMVPYASPIMWKFRNNPDVKKA